MKKAQSMNKNLIDTLMKYESVFICGPRFDDNHLRVYGYGGSLCGIPTTSKAKLALFNPEYVKYCKSDADKKRLITGFDIKPDKEGKNKYGEKKLTNEERYDKFLDTANVNAMLGMLETKFTKVKNGQDSDEGKERKQQTIIARNHMDFQKNGGVVICDFESCIPKEMYAEGLPEAKKELEKYSIVDLKKKNPRTDLIAIKLHDNNQKAILYMIEYKCNKNACVNKTAGLRQHAKDMIVCEKIGDSYKKEILRRFRLMCKEEFCLVQNQPENLDEILKKLEENPSNIELKKCFLFTEGLELTRKTVTEICRSKKCIPELEMREKFCYLFQEEAAQINLSEMKSWADFEISL